MFTETESSSQANMDAVKAKGTEVDVEMGLGGDNTKEPETQSKPANGVLKNNAINSSSSADKVFLTFLYHHSKVTLRQRQVLNLEKNCPLVLYYGHKALGSCISGFSLIS